MEKGKEKLSDSSEMSQYYNEYAKRNPKKSRYGLISIDTQHELGYENPPRIFDRELNKTVFLNSEITDKLVVVLRELSDIGMIGKMAFSGAQVVDGACTEGILQHFIERGSIFELEFDKLRDITKITDEINCGNQLWVRRETTSLYFEELEESPLIEENSVVTRLLHIQVDDTDHNTIVHLDFEYVFYSMQEFEERKTHPNKKGTNHKRKKILKLDECSLPINHKVPMLDTCYRKCEVLFIYFVLNFFFKKKKLLREYFEKYLES